MAPLNKAANVNEMAPTVQVMSRMTREVAATSAGACWVLIDNF